MLTIPIDYKGGVDRGQLIEEKEIAIHGTSAQIVRIGLHRII